MKYNTDFTESNNLNENIIEFISVLLWHSTKRHSSKRNLLCYGTIFGEIILGIRRNDVGRETTFDETILEKTALGEMTFGGMTFGEMTFGEMRHLAKRRRWRKTNDIRLGDAR